MKKISIIALCLLLSGCSIFKESTKEQTNEAEKTELKDITTNTEEQIDIEIPAELFALIHGNQIVPKKEESPEDADAKSDTSKQEKDDQKAEKSKKEMKPVKITIDRKTQSKDNSTTKTDQKETRSDKQVTDRESKDVIGNFKWLILVAGATVIGIAVVVIKFYL